MPEITPSMDEIQVRAELLAEIERLRAALEHFRGLALANGVTLREIADRIDPDQQG